jgi:hypothetical protein
MQGAKTMTDDASHSILTDRSCRMMTYTQTFYTIFRRAL